MGDFKIGNTTPDAGDLKVGSSTVTKIFKGEDIVWPAHGSDEVHLSCMDKTWKTTNSTLVAATDSNGNSYNIPIITNFDDAKFYPNNEDPAAIWWDYNSNNSARGLYYNKWAAMELNPPTGWRKMNKSDTNDLASLACLGSSNFYAYNTCYSKNLNQWASATTTGWDTSTSTPNPYNDTRKVWTNTTGAASSGLDLRPYSQIHTLYRDAQNQQNTLGQGNRCSLWVMDSTNNNAVYTGASSGDYTYFLLSVNTLQSYSSTCQFLTDYQAVEYDYPGSGPQTAHPWMPIRFVKDL